MTDLLVLYQQMKKKALFLWSRRPGSEGDDSGSIKIEQNEAVHGQTVLGGVNICHVNRSSSNVAHTPSTL